MLDINTLYLIKKNPDGTKSEIPASLANFQVAQSGTINFGDTSIISGGGGSVIAGGKDNKIIQSLFSNINGGCVNIISGNFNGALGGPSKSTIAGGSCNSIGGFYNTDTNNFIGGGANNNIGNPYKINSIIGGALIGPIIYTQNSTIAGGFANCIRSTNSFIGAGFNNSILSYKNNAGGMSSAILAGDENSISDQQNTYDIFESYSLASTRSIILGGLKNSIGSISGSSNYNSYNLILNGYESKISGNSYANTIANGASTRIIDSFSNFIGFGGFPNYGSTISGGGGNYIGISSYGNQIYNGSYNFIANASNGGIIKDSNNSFIGTTSSFEVYNSNDIFISNGFGNYVSGVDGGSIIGSFSKIKKNHHGAIIISDGQNRIKESSGPHTLTLDFASGIYINGSFYLNGRYIPSSSNSFGVSGQIATDSNYIYSHNGIKWRRTALSEW